MDKNREPKCVPPAEPAAAPLQGRALSAQSWSRLGQVLWVYVCVGKGVLVLGQPLQPS